jgi:arabinosaccharide transport system substrate-binding protein
MVQALGLLKDLQAANAVATIAGGQPDTEEAYGEYNQGNFAVAIMPEWFMSRYTAYMPDLKGKIAIAPPPVTADAKVKTVGGGGTGTAIPSQGKHTELASQFLAYAKLSKEGAIEIWNSLGFDPCNMALWTDESITKNPANEFNQYFANNVFDVLNQVKDGIGYLPSATFQAMPNVNSAFASTVLNEVFENGADIQATLDQAQADLKNELGQ